MSPIFFIESVSTPWARTMRSLLPVARMTLPSSVPKNQYMAKTMPIENTEPMMSEPVVFSSPRSSKRLSIVRMFRRGRIGLAHDPDVYGIEGDHGENARQDAPESSA